MERPRCLDFRLVDHLDARVRRVGFLADPYLRWWWVAIVGTSATLTLHRAREPRVAHCQSAHLALTSSHSARASSGSEAPRLENLLTRRSRRGIAWSPECDTTL